MDKDLSGGGQARVVDGGPKLSTASGTCRHLGQDDRDCRFNLSVIDAELGEALGVAGQLAGRDESVQPPIVGRSDQVQSATAEPGDHKRPIPAQGSVH